MTHREPTERDLEALLHREVRARLHGHCLKLVGTTVGVPDRLILLPGGRMYLVELKAKVGRLSPVQKVWHARMAELGIQVTTLYGREQLMRWLEEVQFPPRVVPGLN